VAERLIALLLAAALSGLTAAAEDWPTYQHDNRRSGVTSEKPSLPLTEAWTHCPTHPPEPAWPAPAKADFWHNKRDLNPRVTFDRAFHVAVAKGTVFFGSSADDKVYALDAATGTEKWVFFTDGPVRLAPAVAEGRVYVGSDDGSIYCLDGATGKLVWKKKPATPDRFVPGNGRMISVAPVRTGIVVSKKIAYCCAGIFPLEGVRLAAFNARTGSTLWEKAHDISPQGYMLASAGRLYLPTGRTSPVVFARRDGERLGDLKGSAGAYALVTEDLVVHGPGDSGRLGLSDAATRDHLATFPGRHMIINEGISYLHSSSRLSALDRVTYLDALRRRNTHAARVGEIDEELKKPGDINKGGKGKKLQKEREAAQKKIALYTATMAGCTTWDQVCSHPYALILAGGLLFAGGDDSVAAYSAADGALVWENPAEGRVYGLAFAGGRLYVSTDEGKIHCFTGP
jgi:hypothetical protein